MDDATIELVSRYRQGDSQAAEALFDRFVGRLRALAQSRLSSKLGRRLDAEDVVQSAYRSFFVRAREGQFEVGGSGDLWRLLVAITMNKLRGQVEHHSAGKRAYSVEQSLQASLAGPPMEMLTREPAPDEAAALVEQVDGLMDGLSDVQQRMLELRLQGYQIEEIAAEVGRSERGVRRLLDKIKAKLQTGET